MPEACTRGCIVPRQHLQDCRRGWLPMPIDDPAREQLFDGDRALADGKPRAGVWIGRYGGLEVWVHCRGCLPRDATHGFLCEHCHGRLVEWLGTLPWLYRWLDANIVPSGGSAARQDWQRPASSEDLPAPVRVAVLDLRNLLTDRLLELEDCARDVFGRPARSRPFRVVTAVSFLTAWLERIETDLDLVNHVFDLVEDLVRRARTLVPWEDRPRRIAGIACPHCEWKTLEVKPGMEDVTCRNCRAVIPRQRYDIWTRVLAEQAAARSSGGTLGS